jgi:hypothetical protein
MAPLRYKTIANKPRILRALTGLSKEEFENLKPSFARAYEAYWDELDGKRPKPRQRRRGGGRKPVLREIEDKLLFILVYFRLYPTQEVQGFLFGLGQPQANFWIQRLTKVLNQALGYEMTLPKRKPADLEAVLSRYPVLEFVIDGTERPIRRPKDCQRQKKYYSGKKKRHTVKNIVVTTRKEKGIVALDPTVEGKKHDKQAAEEAKFRFPEGSKLWKDKGLQGYEPEGVESFQPKKKPRGRELSEEERERNRAISKERIGVEHAIGGVKRWRIVHDVFRHHLESFEDLVMETACGLYNFRLGFSLLSG